MWRVFSVFRDPYRGYAFRLKMRGHYVGGFSEVTGLAGAQDGSQTAPHSTPLLRPTPDGVYTTAGHPPTIVLKRGLFAAETFAQWLKDAQDSSNLWREDLTIEMRDESGKPVLTYLVSKCWVLKYTFESLSAKSNDTAAIEELLLAFERYELLA